MARYFFSLHDRSGDTPDEEGCELPGAAAVRVHALAAARSLMAEDVRRGHLNLNDYIEVSNERGETVLTLSFASAVTIDR